MIYSHCCNAEMHQSTTSNICTYCISLSISLYRWSQISLLLQIWLLQLDFIRCFIYVAAEIVQSAFYICFAPSFQWNSLGKVHAHEKEYTPKYMCSQKAIWEITVLMDFCEDDLLCQCQNLVALEVNQNKCMMRKKNWDLTKIYSFLWSICTM